VTFDLSITMLPMNRSFFLTASIIGSTFLFGAVSANSAWGDVKMPGIFGDHMVLQEDQTVPVWGWADPGEAVTVTLGTASGSAAAGADGKWRVELPKMPVNHAPQELVIAGKNTIKIEDVLVGEVWLCSGQSNMQFGILNIKKMADLTEPEIRVFCLTKSASLTPMDDTTFVPPELVFDTSTGHWSTSPNSGTWNGFSAVGYLFGQRIHQITGHPVGLIGSYWGGTPAQAWTSLDGLQKNPALAGYVNNFENLTDAQKARFPVVWADYVAAMVKWNKEVVDPYSAAMHDWKIADQKAKDAGTPEPPQPAPLGGRPADPGNVGTVSTLYNGMIHPIQGYGIKGVIWYQGESNTTSGDYNILFPNLIQDWRSKWGQGDFPFFFVQLAGYQPGPTDGGLGHWAKIRQDQASALSLPNTGMATAVDIGDQNNVHPKDKQDVANRLALLAQNRVYGQPVLDSGPTFAGIKIEGNQARVSFDHIGGGLTLAAPPVAPGQDPNPVPAELTGFDIAGPDGVYQPAKGKIDGDTVVVWSDAVPAPVSVRYAWADFPSCSLYNKDGLPAYPFDSGAAK